MTLKKFALSILVIVLVLLIPLAIFWQHKSHEISFEVASFQDLPGWNKTNIQKSFETFKVSCKVFLALKPEERVGSQQIPMQAKDWQPVCRAAMKMKSVSDQSARKFFSQWFTPIAWYQQKPLNGLFTGYYVPYFHGSLSKTKEYHVPVYGLPSNLVSVELQNFDPRLPNRTLFGRVEDNKLLPFYTRKAINEGVLKDKAPVLLWLKSHIDRLFIEIQGSGIVELADNKLMNIGYAGENGGSYLPVGRILVERGVMTKENASMQGIRAYLEAHPDEILPIINQNKSFVFFRILHQTAALGAQGTELTPGYSLAVDRKWIPLGTPMWLNTTRPDPHSKQALDLQRLMIAQDTGGAIRGAVRGDVFWGGGEKAEFIAGTMKNKGRYWLLLPNPIIKQLPKKFE